MSELNNFSAEYFINCGKKSWKIW